MATLIQRLDWKRETGMTVTSGSVGHDCVISATRSDWRPVSRSETGDGRLRKKPERA